MRTLGTSDKAQLGDKSGEHNWIGMNIKRLYDPTIPAVVKWHGWVEANISREYYKKLQEALEIIYPNNFY